MCAIAISGPQWNVKAVEEQSKTKLGFIADWMASPTPRPSSLQL
jgi:hypothetical protein